MRALETAVDDRSELYDENTAAYRQEVATLRERMQWVIDGGAGRDKAIARHLDRGKVMVRDRIDMLIDEGTWEEHFADLEALDRLEFEDTQPYDKKLARAVERTAQKEALLCGIGEIKGERVVLAVLDFGFMGGSMGEVVGEKVALSCDLAAKEGLPLVIFTSSGGLGAIRPLSLSYQRKTSGVPSVSWDRTWQVSHAV